MAELKIDSDTDEVKTYFLAEYEEMLFTVSIRNTENKEVSTGTIVLDCGQAKELMQFLQENLK